jgi:AraC-like DNA-binding protein
LAGLLKELAEKPLSPPSNDPLQGDVLSNVLRTIRLTGSLQFCIMPTDAWQTDAEPSLAAAAGGAAHAIPFHIMVEGTCWLKMEGRETVLAAGDVVVFPFGTGHQLGAGSDGRLITPMQDLPQKPWREIPVLRYGDGSKNVRLLCGFLQCDSMNFRPLRNALPTLLHVRTRGTSGAEWLSAAIRQIVIEVDRPRAGSLSMLERLTEVTFIEILRHRILDTGAGQIGWLAALADPSLGRCLALIHDDPKRNWSVPSLSSASGLSRSVLTERFETMLGTSPMRYIREWRLCLASMVLGTTSKAISVIAQDSGYGTEAAFNRAFSRAYGVPPAAWRQTARRNAASAA